MMLIALIIDSIGPNQVSFASSGGNLDQPLACSQSLMQIIEGRVTNYRDSKMTLVVDHVVFACSCLMIWLSVRVYTRQASNNRDDEHAASL